MLTRTVEVREGEWFQGGTVDEWLAEHARTAGQGSHRALTPQQESMIRKLAGPPPVEGFWVVQTNHDFWHKLYRVGLYDGWVFWHKRLYLGTDGPLPQEHGHEAYNLTGIAVAVQTERSGIFNRGWRIVGAEERA